MNLKYLKAFIFLGVAGFLVAGALLIWAGVSAVQFIASSASAPVVKEQVATLQSNVAEISELNFTPLECWSRAQTLMSVEAWLGTPVTTHLESLKTSCFQPKKGKSI